MKEKIESLLAEITAAIEQTETGRALYEVKVKFQTELKGIMSGMKDLPKEERPTFGKVVNEFKQAMETLFEERAVVVRKMELEAQYAKERIDITMPGKAYKAGALHPITLVKNELTDDLYYTIAQGYLMQIMNISATKWNGIKAMLDICNCSPNETVYFGDDQDDIEPIKMCGLGIAVSNAIDEVKAVADYVIESNDADGVAKFIEHRILKNM